MTRGVLVLLEIIVDWTIDALFLFNITRYYRARQGNIRPMNRNRRKVVICLIARNRVTCTGYFCTRTKDSIKQLRSCQVGCQPVLLFFTNIVTGVQL